MNKNCPLCGGIKDTTGKYCQKCYNYLKIHPEGVYPLPNKGEVVYAPNGDPICHICGMAYRKLGNHIRFKHNISQTIYRETFGLYHNTRLSNDEYKCTMRRYNKDNYDKVVKDNLLKGGAKTRTSSTNVLPGKKMNKKISEIVFGGDINEVKDN